jgi:crossover junction endodeoxyribonuclease RuvC
MRVLAVDPGLTRCGIGVVESYPSKSGRSVGQSLSMLDCGIIRTDKDQPLEQRLLLLDAEIRNWINKVKPDVIAVERVFSQLNVKTAMATGQAAGVVLVAAAQSGIPIVLHTPSEVKAAVTGSGRADKKQVANMVVKILNLKTAPTPVDTTDALALAICHHWRGTGDQKYKQALSIAKSKIKKVNPSKMKP